MSTIFLNDNEIGKIYLNGRKYGGGASEESNIIADVFNHGNVRGLNPNYNIIGDLKFGGGLTITNDYIFRDNYDNATFLFLMPISNKQFSTICFDVEIPNGNAGPYNITTFGCRKWSSIVYGGQYQSGIRINTGGYYGDAINFAHKTLINYGEESNCLGTEPWYKLPRTTIKIQLDNLAEEQFYCIQFHHINSQLYIYSIWLEP